MLLLVGGAVSVTVQLELGLDRPAGRTAGDEIVWYGGQRCPVWRTEMPGMADRDARYGPVDAAGRAEVAVRLAVTLRGRCAQRATGEQC